MMKKRKYERNPNPVPAHITERYVTGRMFKQVKRRQLEEARKAVSNLRFGCAYFPAGPVPVVKVYSELNKLKLQLSQKQWGR